MLPLLEPDFDWSAPALILLDTSGSFHHYFEPTARALAALAKQMEWPATLAFYSNEGAVSKGAPKRGLRGIGLNVSQEEFERKLGAVKAWGGGEALVDLCQSASQAGLFDARPSVVVVGDFMEMQPNDARLWEPLSQSEPQFSLSGLIIGGASREIVERWLAPIRQGAPQASIGAMEFEHSLRAAAEAMALRKETAQAKAPSAGAALRM